MLKLIVVMITYLCKYTKSDGILHVKQTDFILLKLPSTSSHLKTLLREWARRGG